jgi:hypothetical protein
VAIAIGESESPEVVKTATSRNLRDACARWASQQLASDLIETLGPQEFQRSKPDKTPEVLLQRAPRNLAKPREIVDFPVTREVSLEKVDRLLQVMRKRLNAHGSAFRRRPYHRNRHNGGQIDP